MIGTSAAFHLAEAGVDVLLLERAELASGSTSKAAGGVRAQFSDPLNIAIGLRSLEAFERFSERPGAEIDLHRVGYLFLLDREEDVDAFERSVALQNELGVPSRFVRSRRRLRCPRWRVSTASSRRRSARSTVTPRRRRSRSGTRQGRAPTAPRSPPAAR